MAGSLNKVMLIGHLGKDPESRNFPDGGKVVNPRIATSETWRDRATGEPRERTEWHSVAVYIENLQGIAMQYLKKGHLVYIEGALETRKWKDQSGNDRYTTEVCVRNFRGNMEMLSGRGSEDSTSGGGYGGGNTSGGGGYDDYYNQGQGSNGGQQAQGRNGGGRQTQQQQPRNSSYAGAPNNGHTQQNGGSAGGYQSSAY